MDLAWEHAKQETTLFLINEASFIVPVHFQVLKVKLELNKNFNLSSNWKCSSCPAEPMSVMTQAWNLALGKENISTSFPLSL